jgi:hypothetical protein
MQLLVSKQVENMCAYTLFKQKRKIRIFVPAPCSNEMQGIKQQLVEHNSLVLRV